MKIIFRLLKMLAYLKMISCIFQKRRELSSLNVCKRQGELLLFMLQMELVKQVLLICYPQKYLMRTFF